MSVQFFFTLLVALDLVPGLVLLGPIVKRARAAGVRPGPHAAMALIGGLGVGWLMTAVAAYSFAAGTRHLFPPSHDGLTAMMIGGGLFGSTMTAGGAYLHLRMSTRRDPDYEEPQV